MALQIGPYPKALAKERGPTALRKGGRSVVCFTLGKCIVGRVGIFLDCHPQMNHFSL